MPRIRFPSTLGIFAAIAAGIATATLPDAPESMTLPAARILVLLFLGFLPLTISWIWPGNDRKVSVDEEDGTRWGTWILAATAVGILLRLVAPHRLMMYYMGYDLVDQATTLADFGKHGPGALVLHNLLFTLTGPSDRAMMLLNSFLGGMLPLAAASLVSSLGYSRRAAALGAVMLAFLPVAIRTSNSESLLVPMTLWLFLGLDQALRYRRTRDPLMLAGALVHILLAMYARAEAAILAPVFCLVILRFGGPHPTANRPGRFAAWLEPLLLGPAAFLASIRLLHLASAVAVDMARDSFPGVGGSPLMFNADILIVLTVKNMLFRPDLFPIAVTFLALAAPFLAGPGGRRGPLVLLALCAVWIASSVLDAPWVSVPRIQFPGAALAVLAAAIGADAMLSRARLRAAEGRFPCSVAGPLLAALVAGSSVATIPSLWQRTHPDEEAALLRDSMPLLPRTPFTILRRDYQDLPAERIPLPFPEYMFEGHGKPGNVMALSRIDSLNLNSQTVFFILGTRCYLRECHPEPVMHPACQGILDNYRLDALLERDVPASRLRIPLHSHDSHPNRDQDFSWCVAANPMRIGVYRIFPPGL